MQQALSRVERLRRIEQLLYRASEGVRAAEIAEQLGTSQRTVYRVISIWLPFVSVSMRL